MTPAKFGIGQAVRRVEDQKFVTGTGRYSADVMPEGALAGHVLRSPHAKAKIARIDADRSAKDAGRRARPAGVGHRVARHVALPRRRCPIRTAR